MNTKLNSTNKINTEEKAEYIIDRSSEELIINKAIAILGRRLRKNELLTATSNKSTSDYLILNLADLEHEVFGVLLLDNQHKLIKDVLLFRGTIDGASVYPREVVKEALKHNAAAVIFYHNHPSGLCKASEADKNITQRLKTALSTVDIRTLDHIIVGGADTLSFTSTGQL